MNLHDLIHYSVNDLPDITERDKSLMLIKELFTILNKRIKLMNILSAIVCSITTYIAGFIPIVLFFMLNNPWNLITSLSFVAVIAGVFLVLYRARRSAVNWKITFFETGIIILISVIASLFLSGTI
jgi:VIT1/CCC1 family predicted Fe2+/Mn2+ transporter